MNELVTGYPRQPFYTPTEAAGVHRINRYAWEQLKPQPGRQAAAKERALGLIKQGLYVAPIEPGGLDARHMELACEQARPIYLGDAELLDRVRRMDDWTYGKWLEKDCLKLPSFQPA